MFWCCWFISICMRPPLRTGTYNDFIWVLPWPRCCSMRLHSWLFRTSQWRGSVCKGRTHQRNANWLTGLLKRVSIIKDTASLTTHIGTDGLNWEALSYFWCYLGMCWHTSPLWLFACIFLVKAVLGGNLHKCNLLTVSCQRFRVNPIHEQIFHTQLAWFLTGIMKECWHHLDFLTRTCRLLRNNFDLLIYLYNYVDELSIPIHDKLYNNIKVCT